MTLNCSDSDPECYHTSIVHVDGIGIEHVRSFKYLGAHATYDSAGTSDLEITRRIGVARSHTDPTAFQRSAFGAEELQGRPLDTGGPVQVVCTQPPLLLL